MLDAACPGQVFTSPTPDQMAAAAKSVDTGAGLLLIVKNYEGDVMNFEMAAEMLGGRVATVITDDRPRLSPRRSWWPFVRSLVGSYVTSLEMAGCSITVTLLDDQLTALWDAPVQTPALRWGRSGPQWNTCERIRGPDALEFVQT
jgi:dihydroxyacetone kinase